VGALICPACVAAHPFLACWAGAAGGGGGAACAGKEAARSALQPWVQCLTCSGGVDDGAGVCLACAAACHAGHALTPQRISDFFCDCGQLAPPAGAAAAGASGSSSGSAAAAAAAGSCCALSSVQPPPLPPQPPVDAAAAAAAQPLPTLPLSGARRQREAGDAEGTTLPTPKAARAYRWCAARAAAAAAGEPAAAAGAGSAAPLPPMLLEELDTLLAVLCLCEACMAAYARAGLQSWFGAELCVAEDCRLLVGEEGEGGAGGAGAGAAGGAGGGDGGGGGSGGGGATTFDRGMSAFQTLPFHHQAALASGFADLKTALLGFLAQRSQEGGPSVVITKSDVEGFVKKFHEDRGKQ
jgi:hypothetical protein